MTFHSRNLTLATFTALFYGGLTCIAPTPGLTQSAPPPYPQPYQVVPAPGTAQYPVPGYEYQVLQHQQALEQEEYIFSQTPG